MTDAEDAVENSDRPVDEPSDDAPAPAPCGEVSNSSAPKSARDPATVITEGQPQLLSAAANDEGDVAAAFAALRDQSVHEAGHFVACVRLGIRVETVVMSMSGSHTIPVDQRDLLNRSGMIVAEAGNAAQRVCKGTPFQELNPIDAATRFRALSEIQKSEQVNQPQLEAESRRNAEDLIRSERASVLAVARILDPYVPGVDSSPSTAALYAAVSVASTG